MRVLYIDQYFSTREGISGTRSYEFARRMVKDGHRVTVITSASRYSSLYPQKKFIRHLNIEGINVWSVRIQYSQLMGFFRRGWSFVSFMIVATVLGIFQKRHDVVFATSTPLSVGFPGMMISLTRGTPFVFEVRDLWPRAPIELGIIQNQFAIFLLKKFEYALYKHAKKIIALSPGMEEGIIDSGIDPQKVVVIPNACDFDLFDDLPSKNAIRKELGFGDEFIAVYAGTVGIANDLKYLVDVVSHLEKKTKKPFRFLVIGEGNDLGNVKSHARDRCVERIHFLGPVARNKVVKYIAASDMGITIFKNIPVLSTNSPNKFFDYIAAGIPCAVNTSGWTAEEIKKAGAGLLLPPDNTQKAAEKILDVIDHPTQIKIMSKKVKKLGARKFTRKQLGQKLVQTLRAGSLKRSVGGDQVIKAILDWAFAFGITLLLFPLFCVIGVAISFESRGPVFYTQKRTGKDGRTFSLIKFRTMVCNMDKVGLGFNVEQFDSRITKVGHFLREWSLDELPQLLNILKMEMSLIGPRPMLLSQTEKFDSNQKKRLWVRPGITGLAQISGRNLLSWSNRIDLDVRYIDEYSLWLDIKIFFKTFGVVLKKEGLYEPGAGLDDDFNRFDE